MLLDAGDFCQIFQTNKKKELPSKLEIALMRKCVLIEEDPKIQVVAFYV